MDKDLLLAIITTTPAIAWFINAFMTSYKWTKKNEDKIKKVAQDGVEVVKEGAKQVEKTAVDLSKTVETKIKEVKIPAKNNKPNDPNTPPQS